MSRKISPDTSSLLFPNKNVSCETSFEKQHRKTFCRNASVSENSQLPHAPRSVCGTRFVQTSAQRYPSRCFVSVGVFWLILRPISTSGFLRCFLSEVSRETFLFGNYKKDVSGDFLRDIFIGFYIGESGFILLQNSGCLSQFFFIVFALIGNEGTAFSDEREAPS